MEEYTPVFGSQKAISYAIEVENVRVVDICTQF